MSMYETPPPLNGYTAEHFSTQMRIAKTVIPEVIDADWLVSPEQFIKPEKVQKDATA